MPWLCTIQNTSNFLAKTHFRTNNHYEGRKTTLSLLHTFTLTFSFRFLQTSLIIKDLIKHDNKFNRKDFHDRENSENWFSEFSYFMKGFKKYIMNISCSLHNETIVKYVFHEMLWKKYLSVYHCLNVTNNCSVEIKLDKYVNFINVSQLGFQTGVGNNTTYWTQLITTDKFDS